MKITTLTLRVSLTLALVIATTSCRTIQYREVQSDFERAVQAETARAESPFIDWYQGVAGTLTDDFIGKLDEELRPNAWMLRSVAEWRSGSYSNANISAKKGLNEIERHQKTSPKLAASRDSIVLTMLSGLVQDSQLRDKLSAMGTNLTLSSYETNFLPQFKAVLKQFVSSRQKFDEPTPTAVKYYWNFQVWRVLQNWTFTLSKLPEGTDETKAAYSDVDKMFVNPVQLEPLKLGTNRVSAIRAAKDDIPKDHPYRRLIEIEENAKP